MKRYNKPTMRLVEIDSEGMMAGSYDMSTSSLDGVRYKGRSSQGITEADSKVFDDVWEE